MKYVVSLERIVDLLQTLQSRGKGVLNWFVDENNFLQVYYDVDNVTYWYSQNLNSDPEVRIEIKQFLTRSRQILAVQEDKIIQNNPATSFEPVEWWE